MADYDRRPRRGGGQFNNRKRRVRDDDHDDRRPQRRRYEEPVAVTLRKQFLTIAEMPYRKLEEDVAQISKMLADNYFDSDLTSGFLDLAIQITLEQPMKIPFIAAVILLTNARKPEFTPEILKRVGDALQTHIDRGEWTQVKLLLRLLACLQGMFEGSGVFPLLETLFERAVDLQTRSSEDSLGLELIKIILLTIPYMMTSSAEDVQDQANSLLDRTGVIALMPHTLEILVDPYPTMDLSGTTSSESALALLQKHMQEEARNNWELSCLPRPWKGITLSNPDEDTLSQAAKQPLPTITIPETLQIGPHSIFPEIYFSVYTDQQDIATVPPASDSSALLVRDALNDTINGLDFNRVAAAKMLVDVDCYFALNTFHKRATPFDKLREVAGGRTMWKPEDVVVDACFANLFTLPSPEHKLVYYHSVLTEACKLAPAAVAPSLGRAIRFLYRNVDRMDLELSFRFLDWFAHHLSNFGFTWKWTEWVDDVELGPLEPKRMFIQDALDKEIRLSFAQRIRGTVPDEMKVVIGQGKEVDTPPFKYAEGGEELAFASEAREIAGMIRKKATGEELQSVLDKVEGKVQKVDILVTSLCWVGSKSLSHALACVERSKSVLTSLTEEDEDAQKQVVQTVLRYWKDQKGTGLAIICKLVNYGIIKPESVVQYVLGSEGCEAGKGLSEVWVWESIWQIVGKLFGRVKEVVAAARRPGIGDQEQEVVRGVLGGEMERLRNLYGMIKSGIKHVGDGEVNANGGVDGTMTTQEDEALIRVWAARWEIVVKRKEAVDEMWVKEEMAKPIPQPEVAEVKMDDAEEGVDGEREGKRQKTETGENGVKTEYENGDDEIS